MLLDRMASGATLHRGLLRRREDDRGLVLVGRRLHGAGGDVADRGFGDRRAAAGAKPRLELGGPLALGPEQPRALIVGARGHARLGVGAHGGFVKFWSGRTALPVQGRPSGRGGGESSSRRRPQTEPGGLRSASLEDVGSMRRQRPQSTELGARRSMSGSLVPIGPPSTAGSVVSIGTSVAGQRGSPR